MHRLDRGVAAVALAAEELTARLEARDVDLDAGPAGAGHEPPQRRDEQRQIPTVPARRRTHLAL